MQEILKYIKVIRKWWWVIVLLSGGTVGTMMTIAFFTETEYEATVTVQVSAPPPQETPLFSDFGRQAVTDQIEQTRNSLSEFLQNGDASSYALERLPEDTNIRMDAAELREKITIELPQGSQLMRISVRATDAETAALLANAVVEVTLELYGELLARSTANTRSFIERELELARAELIEAETALAQFQIDNKVGDLNRAVQDQYQLVRTLKQNSDLAAAEGDLAKAESLKELSLKHETELQNMIGLSAEYNGLIDRVQRARSTNSFLLETKSEAQIKENQILEMGSIQIITQASPPRRPVSALDSKLIVLGGIVSALTGVLMAFLLQYLEVSGAFRGFQRQLEHAEPVAFDTPSKILR